MSRLLKRNMAWTVFALAALGAMAVAAFLGARSWLPDGLDAAAVVARSCDAEAEILARATEGTVLHYRTQEYLGQGPAAPLVQELRKDDFYVPESIRTEAWSQVGPSGRITHLYGRMTDEEDRLVVEVTTEGNEVVTRAPASGAEQRQPMDWSVEDVAGTVGADVRQLEESIGAGAAKVVGYGGSGGKKTIILELLRVEEPEPPEPDVKGYTLPYTLDLNSVERVIREEVGAETFMPYRWWMVAVDAGGEEHLIWDVRTLVYEVLEPAAVP